MDNKSIKECLQYLFNYPQVYLEKSYKASSRKSVIYHRQIENLLIENIRLAAEDLFSNKEISPFFNLGKKTEYLDLTPEEITNQLKENFVVYIPYKNREYLPEAFKNVQSLYHMENTVFSSLFPHDVDECEIKFFPNGIKISAPGLSSYFTMKDNQLIFSDNTTIKSLTN